MFLEGTTLPELTSSDLPGNVQPSLIISEPNFSLSLLPWHNLLAWYCLDQVLADDEPGGGGRKTTRTMLAKAELWGVPVHYRDLWKIRAPLHTVEAGFKMKPFDDIIMVRYLCL